MSTIYDAYRVDREKAGKASAPRIKDAWKRLRGTFENLLPGHVTVGHPRPNSGAILPQKVMSECAKPHPGQSVPVGIGGGNSTALLVHPEPQSGTPVERE